MFDGSAAADLLFSLMNDAQKEEAEFRIREEYHSALPQAVSHELRVADPGTAEWFWARGIPNALKTEFFKGCKSEKIPSNIDSLVASLEEFL